MSNHGQLAAEQTTASFHTGVPGETIIIATVGPLEKIWLNSMAAQSKRDKFDEAADQKPSGVAASNGSSSCCSGVSHPPESEGNSRAKCGRDADGADVDSRSGEVSHSSLSGGSRTDGRSNRQLDFERRGYKRRRAGKNLEYYAYWSCPRAGPGQRARQ